MVSKRNSHQVFVHLYFQPKEWNFLFATFTIYFIFIMSISEIFNFTFALTEKSIQITFN